MEEILVAAPTFEGMDYCFNDFVNCLKTLDKDNFTYKILIVDNSKSKKYFRKINKIKGIKVIYDDSDEEDNFKRLISSRNKILEYAVKKGFDYLLMMDVDVMIPRNILTKLLSHNKDVVSGLYFNIFPLDGEPNYASVAYMPVTKEEYEEQKSKNKIPFFIKSEKDWLLRRHLYKSEMKEAKLLEVKWPCNGCLLLSRTAFTSGVKYLLWDDPLLQGVKTSDDIHFFKNLRDNGFKMYCDCSLICEHRFKEKYVRGIHPILNP